MRFLKFLNGLFNQETPIPFDLGGEERQKKSHDSSMTHLHISSSKRDVIYVRYYSCLQLKGNES